MCLVLPLSFLTLVYTCLRFMLGASAGVGTMEEGHKTDDDFVVHLPPAVVLAWSS